MKIAAVVVLAMTALAMLALILASVAVIFAEREMPDFEDKAFVFVALAMLGALGMVACVLVLASLT